MIYDGDKIEFKHYIQSVNAIHEYHSDYPYVTKDILCIENHFNPINNKEFKKGEYYQLNWIQILTMKCTETDNIHNETIYYMNSRIKTLDSHEEFKESIFFKCFRLITIGEHRKEKIEQILQ